MFRIALVHPEIPPNTGQIARLCAATGVPLHIVRPIGFRIDDRSLRRAGLDYWQQVDLHVHASLEAFFVAAADEPMWLFTKSGQRLYHEIAYRPGDWLVFGGESEGLPPELLAAHLDRGVRVPMRREIVRSLNLASCASIVLYEALRQNGFQFE